jgi:hypothetical protein
MPHLYALLVAVDTYPDGIRSLAGCVNDANAIQDLLQSRFAPHNLHLLRLNNEQATRTAIIQSFRTHLGQAAKDDIALFFYAGHGSQTPTGGLFQQIEPDGLNESIVCHDSRPHGLDLVDKDIATLITELTSRGIHVTTIFDSCHSGSITRGLDDFSAMQDDSSCERRIAPRHDPQPADAYLANPAALEAAVRDIPAPPPGLGSLTLATSAFTPDDSGMHVLLAACEDNQTAKEYFGGGKRHGAFSYFLTQTLRDSVQPLSYRDLMQLVSSSMQDRVAAQTPRLESAGGDALFHNAFLGLTPAAFTDCAIARLSDATSQWQLDRGALLRISLRDRFALYPLNTGAADLADLAKAAAFATVTALQPATATLQLDPSSQLDEGASYKAVIASRAAAVPVSFEGAPSAVALLTARAASARQFRVAPDPRLRVLAKDGSFTITTAAGDRTLYGPVPQDPVAQDPVATDAVVAADAIVAALEHIALWKLRLELSSPALAPPTTRLPLQTIDFFITLNPHTPAESRYPSPPPPQLTLTYLPDAMGNLQKPTYTARIRNNHTGDLYVALLLFSDDFSISTRLIAAGTQRLAPGEEVYANQGKPVRCTVSPGSTDSIDEVLLLVSTDRFEATAFSLSPLLPYGVTERGQELDDEEDATPLHDFFTRRVTFHTVRPPT